MAYFSPKVLFSTAIGKSQAEHQVSSYFGKGEVIFRHVDKGQFLKDTNSGCRISPIRIPDRNIWQTAILPVPVRSDRLRHTQIN